MTPPAPEDEAILRWHNAPDLSTPAGAAEAKAILRKFEPSPGSKVKIEYDESSNFRSGCSAGEVIAHLDACDPGWATAAPFHVEVGPLAGACPPPAPRRADRPKK